MWSCGSSASPLADMGRGGVKGFSIAGSIAISAVSAFYAGWLFYQSRTPDDALFEVHSFLLTALLVTWVVADTQDSRRDRCPAFDFGAFIFALFPLYIAYYLISTRRWRRGMLMLAGIVLLFWLPWLGEWTAWVVRLLVWATQWLIWLVKSLLSYVR